MRHRAALLVLLLASATTAAAQQKDAPNPAPPPTAEEPEPVAKRVTADLDNLTLVEAAKRVSELTGQRISVPDPSQTGSLPWELPGTGAARRLDYNRRARLSWKDAPVSAVLREFCRAYGCRLQWDYQDNERSIGVYPGPLPSGPVAHLKGYSVEITRLGFNDYRTSGENVGMAAVNQSVSVEFAIRSDSGDLTPVCALDNVRLVDQSGRGALAQQAEFEQSGPGGRSQPTPFPDERGYYSYVDWPYPAPQRFRVIEGDLVLYRKVKRATAVLPVPRGSQMPDPVPVGDALVQMTQYTAVPGGFRAAVRFMMPQAIHLEVLGSVPEATAVLPDGRRVPVRMDVNGYWDVDDNGVRGFQSVLRVSGLPSPPVRLIWRLALKSDPTTRLHFRFDDYPAQLAPASGPAPARPPRPAPAPARKPAAPVRSGGRK